ncbi:MAG: polyprenyl diphosphate synthase [archaeon]|nr:polyprenyl diphosphate synthase [archaeon]
MDTQVKHIGIIVDGNRRFAKAQSKKPWEGHREGANILKDFFNWSKELKIKEITAYVLSTENLNREKQEVDELFKLFKEYFKELQKDKKIDEEKVKISFIGDLSLVPKDIKELAEKLMERTKNYENYKINFCFAYGGRNELVYAVNKLLKENKKQITEQDITNSLWLQSEPDFIIRTGGKIRTSNFLPWQSVYSEWIFLEKMWPEITKEDLIECIDKFKSTQRNFGK